MLELKRELEKKNEETEKIKEEEGDRRSKSRSQCHTPCGLAGGTLSLSSCLPGHTVLVMWDPAHINYTVMQASISRKCYRIFFYWLELFNNLIKKNLSQVLF